MQESASSSSSAAAAPETPPAFANLKLKRTPAAAAEGGSTPATPAAAGGADPAGAAGHAGRQSSPFGDVKLRNVSSGSSRTPGQASALPQAVEGPQTSPFGNIKLRSTGVVIDRAPGPLRKSPRESVASPSPVKTALPTATVAQAMPAASPPAGNYKDPESTRFSYAQLKAHDPAIEADVDPVRRPLYLSEAEMKEVMGVTRQEYLALKPWKQSDLRKVRVRVSVFLSIYPNTFCLVVRAQRRYDDVESCMFLIDLLLNTVCLLPSHILRRNSVCSDSVESQGASTLKEDREPLAFLLPFIGEGQQFSTFLSEG